MTRWLAADEVAALLDRDPAAVYRLAYRRRWRRYVHDGRTHYALDDIVATTPALALCHATPPVSVAQVNGSGRS
jgi:hypothetical protein